MHEWPLLLFTLLFQGSVGGTFFLTMAVSRTKTVPEENIHLLPGLFFACIAGGLGLLASTLHLGYPLNAFNALRHAGSSWLSREIIFASVYLAVLGLCTLFLLRNKRLVRGLLPAAALLGLIDVWCMSAIYAHSSIITWMHVNTWLMFYGAVVILGAVALAWLPLLNTPQTAEARQTMLRLSVVLVMLTLAIRLLAQPAYIHSLSVASLNDVVTLPYQPVEAYHHLSGLRLFTWVLSAGGTLLFAVSGWRNKTGGLILGSLLLVTAEILFRFVFFSIH